MGGETGKHVSGWTVDSLHQHITQQLVDLQLRLDERYLSQTKAMEVLDREMRASFGVVQREHTAAFVAAEKAVQASLASAKEAVTKAEASTEKRFESVNEFRRALGDQTAQYLTRNEYSPAHTALVDRLDGLTERMNRADGQDAGQQLTRAQFAAGLSALVLIVGLLVLFANVVTSH